MEKTALKSLAKLAKAGKWLFWISLVAAAYGLLLYLVSLGFYRMNPVARASFWGKFRWYLPSIFDYITLFVPLIPLYLFQSKLAKGCKEADDDLIEKGLLYLYWYLLVQIILVGLNLGLDFLFTLF